MTTGPVPHVGGPVIGPGAPTVLIGGIPAARVGDLVTCVGPPDTIAKGSASVLICGQPAARLGDQTVHGGVIILGNPTVLIGDAGGGGAAGAVVIPVSAPGPAPAQPPRPLTRDQVTWRLQKMTTAAAKKIDALGDDAFTPAQQAAMKKEPYLRPMYRGSAIDAEVREQVANDPQLEGRLNGQPNKGVDFTDNITGQKYDMTTPGQQAAHLNKYGDDTIVLNTNGSEPIMPRDTPIPPDTPPDPISPAPEPVSPPAVPETPMIPETPILEEPPIVPEIFIP